jgi:hypothetical protein
VLAVVISTGIGILLWPYDVRTKWLNRKAGIVDD